MKRTILLVTALVLSHSQAFACNSLNDVAWLEGHWQSDVGKLQITEHWTKVSPGTLEGKGETISLGDNKVRSSESLRLVEMSGEVFYLAKVKSNEFPVPFKLIQCDKTKATFENKAHDFPNRLVYNLVDQHALSVHVTDNQGEGFNIEFSRVLVE